MKVGEWRAKPLTPRSLTVLGIDPGPTECGWMCLRITEGPISTPAIWLGSGKIESHLAPISKLVVDVFADERIHVVAIERPKWQDHGRDPKATRAIAANLIETNYVVARIAALAIAFGASVLEIPAQTWRQGLLRDRAAQDREIAIALRPLIFNLPKRTNAHERDAGGVAIAAARLIANRMEKAYASSF